MTTTMMGDYNLQQRHRMLGIARTALTHILSYRDPAEPAIEPHEDYLLERRGCFVTLHHRHGHLRGCIGSFEPDLPLGGMIVRMAAAATRDPRFFHSPVVLAEINDLHVEVSVLTPMQRVTDPLSMRLGIDGISIRGRVNGRAVGGCFLPQVAVDQRWTVEQTLSYCCTHKMGLPADAWRPRPRNGNGDGDASGGGGELEFYVFQSVIVAEADHV